MVEICQCFVWRDEAPVFRMTWKGDVEDIKYKPELMICTFFHHI
jgi:hypothetical protein